MEYVNHPKHYNVDGRKECIVEIEEKYGKYILVVFCLTNAYKYLYRAGLKPDNPEQQDLDKARFYFNYIRNCNSEVCRMGKRVSQLYYDVRKELVTYDQSRKY